MSNYIFEDPCLSEFCNDHMDFFLELFILYFNVFMFSCISWFYLNIKQLEQLWKHLEAHVKKIRFIPSTI